MNSNTKTSVSEKPDVISWAASLLSLGILYFGINFLTERLETLRKRFAQANLESTLDENSIKFKSIIPALSAIDKPQGIAKFLATTSENSVLEKLNEASLNIQNDSYLQAKDKLLELDSEPSFASKSELEGLNTLIDNLGSFNNAKSAVSKELDDLNQVSVGNISSFKSLRSDILTFFGFNKDLVIESESEAVAFYQEGILQGLPVLKGFPDNIADLQAFAELLVQNGGKITIPDDSNPQVFFQEKLQNFQDESFNLSLAYSKNSEKHLELEESLKVASGKLQVEKQEITKALNNLALKSAKI